MTCGSRVLAAAMVAQVGLSAGCGGPNAALDAAGSDTGAAPLDAPSSSGVLVRASEGGLVESADGLFEIYVFPGALAEDTTISITRVADADVPADVAATEPISAVYSVEPDGLTFGGDGAWGYFTFPGVPPGLISSDTPPLHSTVRLHARATAGGPIEDHEGPHAYYAADGSFYAYGRLAHLSLQWTAPGATYQTGRLGVDWPASTQAVGTRFSATAVVSAPEEIPTGLTYLATSQAPIRAVRGMGSRDSYLTLPPDGARLWGHEYDVPLPPGTTFPLVPAPTWRCLLAGSSSLFLATTLFVMTGSGPQPHHIEVARTTSCVEEPAVEVSIFDTLHAEREELSVSIGGVPLLEARVDSRPATTQTVSLPTSTGEPSEWFATLSPAADPPATGPGPITATNSGATMTATPDAMTGEYLTVIDDPAIWQTDAPTRFMIGGVVSDVMPPSEPRVTFGPVAGLDTTILPSAPDAELDVRIRIPGTTTCMGEDVQDLVIFRRLDGSTVSLPLREGLELGAALCGRTVDELIAADFYIEAGTRSSKVVDVGTSTVRITTGRTYQLDGRELLATCSAPLARCAGACVNTSTNPMHCGGCGRMPAEVCDGDDDDCDGMTDEGCPNMLLAPASTLISSSSFGEGVGGSSELSTGCPYPTVATSLCGNIDTAGAMPTGNVRALRLGCGVVELVTDRTTSPWTYSLRVTGSPPCAISGGGSSGGMPFDFPCPGGEVLEGIDVVAGSHIGQIQARCARWEILPSSGTWIIARTSMSSSPMFGTGSGTPDGWTVPARSTSGFPGVIRSLSGRYEVPGTFVRVEAGGAWYSLTYR